MSSRYIKIIFLPIALCIFLPLTISGQNLIWQTNKGGVYNEGGYAGVQTDDGNYIVLGNTFSFGAGDFDIYLLKLNSVGDTIWTRTYGGDSTEYGYDIQKTSDGGYILVGSTRSIGNGKRDVYLVRIDSLGQVVWSRAYGGAQDDEGCSVRASGTGYIICGTTSSRGAGYSDLYLIRTNAVGDTLWTRTFGGAGGESGSAVREVAGGGYIAVGSTGSFGEGYSSIYLVRVGISGDSLWAATLGGSKADFGSGVEIAQDGGFVIVGSTASFGAGYSDAYLIKTDISGAFLWEKTYGGIKDDHGYSIYPSRDGGYIITGTTESFGAQSIDIYVIKIDFLGNEIWSDNYGGAKSDFGRMVFQDQGRDYMVVGYSYSNSSGGSDIYIAKLKGDATPVDDNNRIEIPSEYVLSQNYPNPFNLTTRIDYTLPRRAAVSLTVYNILGQDIRRWQFESQPAGTYSIAWDGNNNGGSEVSSGIYFMQMKTEDFSDTRKMVLVK
jgi:hypothetical protein